MEKLGAAVMILGFAVMVLAQLWVLVAAFKKGILWGLLVFFLPFVSLLFIILNFSEMKFPVAMYALGIVVALAGAGVASRGTSQRLAREQAAAAAAAE